MNLHRWLPALVVAVVLILAPPALASHIQPGAYHETDVGACTLNFVYDGSGGPYMGTAAHCVEAVGDDVRDENGAVFGDVAAIGDADATATDWALIRVRPGFVGHVNPSVKGHPQYPTGVTTAPETAVGDQVQLSGYGLGFDLTPLTREQRRGALTFDDRETHEVLATLIFGDSGGPLVHIATGKALGIVSRLCIGLCEEEGPTVEGILAKAAAAGFPVSVRTAG
jgi:Trypsin